MFLNDSWFFMRITLGFQTAILEIAHVSLVVCQRSDLGLGCSGIR